MKGGVIYKDEAAPASVDKLSAVAERSVPVSENDLRVDSF
jgi:hypothetical protein